MPEDMIREVMKMTMPMIVLIGLFTFLSIAAWADARKKEREAYYRSEVRKKLIEQWGADKAAQVIELLREDAKHSGKSEIFDMFASEKPTDPARRRERLILAGLVTMAVGVGLVAGLQFIAIDGLPGVGLLPLLVGVAVLVHAFFFAPKGNPGGNQNKP